MFCTQKEDSKLIVLKNIFPGPWWWSSGQRARLLLRRFKFESRFSVKFVCEKNENKQKEAGAAPLFYKKILPIHFTSIPSYALFDSS